MAKLDVPPTKSKLLELQKANEFARDGFDLLETKRSILTIELTGQLDAVRHMERELEPLLARAFSALRDAALASGSEALYRQSFAPTADHDVTVSTRPLMGLQLPSLEARYGDPPAQLGALDSSAHSDEVARLFNEVLRLVGRLAELQNLVIRLARELKKTQRRVNALEKQFIPSYEETIRYISDSLEERERETVVVMKMIKKRLAREDH